MNAEAIAGITTAFGTLVLAVATFFSTRTANRASRVAERSLLDGLRPVLMHARIDDPLQKIGFVDQHWVHVEGSGAVVEVTDEVIYLAMALRNVGSGIAVLQGWHPVPERQSTIVETVKPEEFRVLTRDLYIPPGDVGFWQGAFRDPKDPLFSAFAEAARQGDGVTVDLLYTDLHGGQRAITRFSLVKAQDERWMAAVGRHWILDGESPR